MFRDTPWNFHLIIANPVARLNIKYPGFHEIWCYIQRRLEIDVMINFVHWKFKEILMAFCRASHIMSGHGHACRVTCPLSGESTSHGNMMTSSNGNISALLVHSAGHSPVTGEFLAQRPVTWCFDVFFDLCLNKWLSKQSWGWWFETPSRSLWRNCNDVGSVFLIRSILVSTVLLSQAWLSTYAGICI